MSAHNTPNEGKAVRKGWTRLRSSPERPAVQRGSRPEWAGGEEVVTITGQRERDCEEMTGTGYAKQARAPFFCTNRCYFSRRKKDGREFTRRRPPLHPPHVRHSLRGREGVQQRPPPLPARARRTEPVIRTQHRFQTRGPGSGSRGRRRAASKLRHPLKSLTPALLPSQPANLKRKPPENMFSCKIYKELRRGAHGWEWRASSRSPRSGFLQRFGTSGSLLAGAQQPEREWDTVRSQGGRGRAPAGEGVEHSPLPGRPGPGSCLEEGRTSCVRCCRDEGRRGVPAPCPSQASGARATRPGVALLHRPGPGQIRSTNEQRGAHGK